MTAWLVCSRCSTRTEWLYPGKRKGEGWLCPACRYGFAPCHEQPGKQQWHLECALRHPLRYLRSRGPKRWRYRGPLLSPEASDD